LGTGTADAFILLRSGGSQSVLASTSANTILANDDIRCSVRGNTITFTDVTQGTTLVSTTDSTIPAGYPGIYIGGSGSILTNWAGGGYAPLLQLTTLATDNFQRADSPTLGANWTVGHGTFALQIVSNQVESAGQGQPPGAGHGKEYYSAVSFASDQWSQAAVVSSTNDVNGAITRYQGSVDTHYVGFVSQTGGAGACSVSIDVDIAGAPTVIAADSTYCSVTASDLIQLSSRGSLHTLVDITSGAVLLAAIDTQITGGAPGWSISPTGGTPIMDNWSGGGFGGYVSNASVIVIQ
jgi:hypothetical protein